MVYTDNSTKKVIPIYMNNILVVIPICHIIKYHEGALNVCTSIHLLVNKTQCCTQITSMQNIIKILILKKVFLYHNSKYRITRWHMYEGNSNHFHWYFFIFIATPQMNSGQEIVFMCSYIWAPESTQGSHKQ